MSSMSGRITSCCCCASGPFVETMIFDGPTKGLTGGTIILITGRVGSWFDAATVFCVLSATSFLMVGSPGIRFDVIVRMGRGDEKNFESDGLLLPRCCPFLFACVV